jgi:PKD repeat protein
MLGLQSEFQMGSKLGLQRPISTLALIKKYEQLPPKASFKVVPGSGTMPLTVQFTDESLGYITARNWKFDDGGTSTDRDPTHVYRTPKQEFTGSAFDLLGCFEWNPTLTVSNKAGSDTAKGSVDVGPAPPVAKFTATPTHGPAKLFVSFAVDRSAGYCLTHNWNFGDPASGAKNTATTSGQAGPYHTFDKPGTYNVTLKVSNTAGESYAGTTITVTDGSGGSPPPPSGNTPYITAGRDPNNSGVNVSGSKFTPNTLAQINITKDSDQPGQPKPLLASVNIATNSVGTFSPQFINVASCSGSESGSTEYTIYVQATDKSGAMSNTVNVSCYATDSP